MFCRRIPSHSRYTLITSRFCFVVYTWRLDERFQGYPAEGGNLKIVSDDGVNDAPTKENILKAIRSKKIT